MGRGSGLKARIHNEQYQIYDNFSRYFLCSNDSNGMRVERKLIRGIGIRGDLVRKNGVCVTPAKPRDLQQYVACREAQVALGKRGWGARAAH